jgi:flagellar basal body rod protein FlgC
LVQFVCACRRGEPVHEAYDAIFGPVANDKIYVAVDMFAKGLWDMARTLDALRFYEANDQVCLSSQQLIGEQLTYLKSYEVEL